MNKKSKAKTNFNRNLLDISAIGIAAFMSFLIINDVIKIHNLNDKTNLIEENLSLAKEENENLKTTIVKLQDNDYLSKFAREKLLYSKENELIINSVE
ncbi:MAG: FtsB family cell division protein [Bacilli bacterium]